MALLWSNSKLSKLNFKTLSQGGNGAGRVGTSRPRPDPQISIPAPSPNCTPGQKSAPSPTSSGPRIRSGPRWALVQQQKIEHQCTF